MSAEPTTTTGRALTNPAFRAVAARIEAEAAANERARLLRAIEDIPPQVGAEALLSEIRKVFTEGGTDR